MSFTFRPHHFLCALCFQGKGYTAGFINNFQTIMDALNSETGDHTPIDIVDHTDSICSPCPHRSELTCDSEAHINALDYAHAKTLNIQSGDTLTWGEAKNRIKENMSLEKFHTICETCNWKKLGICENALTTFLK